MVKPFVPAYSSIDAIKQAMGSEIQTDDIVKVPVELLFADPSNSVRDYESQECQVVIKKLTSAWSHAANSIQPMWVAIDGERLLVLDGLLRYMALKQAIAQGASIDQIAVHMVGERCGGGVKLF